MTIKRHNSQYINGLETMRDIAHATETACAPLPYICNNLTEEVMHKAEMAVALLGRLMTTLEHKGVLSEKEVVEILGGEFVSIESAKASDSLNPHK
jgi:hypothetical protein